MVLLHRDFPALAKRTLSQVFRLLRQYQTGRTARCGLRVLLLVNNIAYYLLIVATEQSTVCLYIRLIALHGAPFTPVQDNQTILLLEYPANFAYSWPNRHVSYTSKCRGREPRHADW